MKLIKGFICILLLTSVSMVNAGWTVPAPIKKINIGPNGVHGTAIQLDNINFTGCTNSNSVIVLPVNPNYKEIVSVLLSARVTRANVQVLYTGCSSGYSVVQEVVL